MKMNKTWSIRLDKIAYGLFYPAFFGNMIYDLINIFLSKKRSSVAIFDIFSHFNICLLIVAFVIIDFIHLQADMNEIYKKPTQKTFAYLICDVITPSLLFLSFVFLKNGFYFFGIVAFGLVPCTLYFYKRENIKSQKYFRNFRNFSIAMGLVLCGITFIDMDKIYLRGLIQMFIIICLFVYWRYIFYLYPDDPRKEDKITAKAMLDTELLEEN